ncbi:F510_1955 family glycosylhydrolase [Phytoactinopolyspora limicola]|uniref:F510_1955 family glycosylhydrolase n=1 Tax=Phytoactinopolyspora limicola TaxID=2715536 RepID=UPI0014093753|nr:exo-alpha-sialidase [Phytoactinopolyspora limicola]
MTSRWRLGKAIAAMLAIGLLAAGCGGDDDGPAVADDHGPGAPAESPDADEVAPAFGHIHGLGVIDDVVYVATHFGLFAVDGGEVSRVSDDDHDFMGFTVVDDTTFLASGHPNSRTDLPGNLGLLRSPDRGRTWENVALSGEVDFHALDTSNGVIFGFDSTSGELMTSDDGELWEHLGQHWMADLAISPDDPSTLAITTEAGLMISEDAGATFDVLDEAPSIMFVEWTDGGDLYGVGPDGAVYSGGDDGRTWDERARLGARPQALAVSADGDVYVALEDSLLRSTDAGASFSEVHTW